MTHKYVKDAGKKTSDEIKRWFNLPGLRGYTRSYSRYITIPRRDTEGSRPYIDKCRNTRSLSFKFESGSKNKIPICYINPYGGNLNDIGPK
jgi:hypothetical protein